MAEKAELLPAELALGTLSEKLPTTEDLKHLRIESATSRRCCSSVGECTRQSSMYTCAHRPSGPDAPGTPP